MMKIQKIMGWERYQVLSDDNRPLCIVEMGSAASVIEMRAIKDAILGIDNTDLPLKRTEQTLRNLADGMLIGDAHTIVSNEADNIRAAIEKVEP